MKTSSTPNLVYLCAEYALTDLLPIYSGGLGVLAGDYVSEMARKSVSFSAVGLFYREGYFHQHIDPDGQKEFPDHINPVEAGLELLKDEDGETLLLTVPWENKTVYVQVWRHLLAASQPDEPRYLYLLDTDHWKNDQAVRDITKKLYPGDPRSRLAQEAVLGFAGFRLIRHLELNPDAYHLNEGHSAFLYLELLREELASGKHLDDALPAARKNVIFTNHTLVPAGSDRFEHGLIEETLGQYLHEAGIELGTIFALGEERDEPGFVNLTRLALNGSMRHNAVSKLHAREADKMWPNQRFVGITNGINLDQWVAPEWQHLFDLHLADWRNKAALHKTWKPLLSLTPNTVWETHLHLKERMLDEVYARTGVQLDVDALTIVWARRFATYKRPDLLFSDLERLKKLLFDADQPVQIIVSGKSHPNDNAGKEIIAHIDELAKYELKHRAVFVDDYGINLAKLLVSGADVWLNTPIYGWEASGTSGMKASANGVLQCTVPDGWAAEVAWRGLGFALPQGAEAKDLYETIENVIIPLFYRRGADELPLAWVRMMQKTLINLPHHFNTGRMYDEYAKELYNPTFRA